MSFDPLYPPIFNSINALVLADVAPNFPSEFLKKKGYDILSTQALANLIRNSSLALDKSLPDALLNRQFYEFAEHKIADCETIIWQMGLALAAILYCLINSNETIHAANPSKDRAYWAYWQQLRRVIVGGGLASGKVGQAFTNIAEKQLQVHFPDFQLEQAKYPAYLPLLGAARYVLAGNSALVFDFGGTFVKQGIAYYEQGILSRLTVLDSIPFDATGDDKAEVIAERFLNIIAHAYQPVEASILPISIAAYVDKDGQPYQTQHGIYSKMASLSDTLALYLSSQLRECLGDNVSVKLLHDGISAASFYAPLDHAAVIMIGTALGTAYPVSRPCLCRVSPKFFLKTPRN